MVFTSLCQRMRGTALIAFSTLATLQSGSALAQAFPSQNIRIVVAAAPSTPPDIVSRIIANEIGAAEGWTVFVENRPGAGQTIGGAEVVRSPADGHTIWGFSMPVTAAPALLANISFDLAKDFEPVIKVTTSYNVLVVTPSVPAKNVAELIAALKAKPDTMSYSTGGLGTPAHLIGEMFKQRTGAKAAHVPYAQFPQAISDLISGVNQYMFITTLPVVELVASGKLRALAVTAPARLASFPGVPTIGEQGFPELAIEDWVGFSVRKGTPPAVVARLNAAVAKALAKDSVKEALAKIGAVPAGGSPEQFAKLVTDQIAHWSKVIREAGLKPN